MRFLMNEQIHKAYLALKSGGVVVFPTDTVWGIGAFVGSDKGVLKLYDLKKRDQKKPTALLVGSLVQAENYGTFSQKQLEQVQKYWPGALTVVVRGKPNLPKSLYNEAGGIGIRWPKSVFVEGITQLLSGGLVTASANVAGGFTPTRYSEIQKELVEKSDFVVKYDTPLSGTASTVIDLMNKVPRIIRQGGVFFEGAE